MALDESIQVGARLRSQYEHICNAEEHGEVEDLPISKILVDGQLIVHPAVSASRYLGISIKGNELRLRAGPYVGLIPINDRVAVRVRPRVNIRSLTRLLRISGYVPAELPEFERTYEEEDEVLPSILGILAEAFVEAVELVVHGGLLQDYRLRVEDSSFPKGRILLRESMRHLARGNNSRVRVQYADRGPDEAVNRLLKYVIVLLANQYRVLKQPRSGTISALRRLNRLNWHFRQVAYDSSRSFLTDNRVKSPELIPFARAYYTAAVRLGSLLAQGRGIEIGSKSGSQQLPTLLLDLAQAFEAYLRNALTRDLVRILPGARVFNGTDSVAGARKGIFDPPNDSAPQATPDIIVRGPENADQPPLIIEVKYKPVRDEIPRDDLNQTITYGFAYQARVAIIAHPTWNATVPNLMDLGWVAGLRLMAYRFNLGSSDLEREETRFAEEIANLASPGT